jgi:hypothetical protein
VDVRTIFTNWDSGVSGGDSGDSTFRISAGADEGPVLKKGARVDGRYEIMEPLGAGSYSRVYRAWDPTLHREVALKLYNRDVLVQIPRQEVTLQAQCQHPNLMPLYDASTDAGRGTPFVVMPVYPGMDLEMHIRERGPFPFKKALLCADQICSALEFLWIRRKAIHGDVKPANIWLTSEGTAVLMDFNLRGALIGGGDLTAGTPGYTAPEALSGMRDQRADVFSMGCVLYRLLTGTAPFADHQGVLMENPPPPSHLRPEISPVLDEIIMTALAKDPGERFQSAAALRGALRSSRYASHPLLAGFWRMLGGSRRLHMMSIIVPLALLSVPGILLLCFPHWKPGAFISLASTFAASLSRAVLQSRIRYRSMESIYVSLWAPGADSRGMGPGGSCLLAAYIAALFCPALGIVISGFELYRWLPAIILWAIGMAVFPARAPAPFRALTGIPRIALGLLLGAGLACTDLGALCQAGPLLISVFLGPGAGITSAIALHGAMALSNDFSVGQIFFGALLQAAAAGLAGSAGFLRPWRIIAAASLPLLAGGNAGSESLLLSFPGKASSAFASFLLGAAPGLLRVAPIFFRRRSRRR